MCLSNVYKRQISDNNLLLNNVQRIECRNGTIVLTDIMERQVSVEGEILLVDLIENKVIIAPKED